MILTDSEILRALEKGDIVIDPFDRVNLGTNSYDVHLGNILAIYEDKVLDAKKHNKINQTSIPKEGFMALRKTNHNMYLKSW